MRTFNHYNQFLDFINFVFVLLFASLNKICTFLNIEFHSLITILKDLFIQIFMFIFEVNFWGEIFKCFNLFTYRSFLKLKYFHFSQYF